MLAWCVHPTKIVFACFCCQFYFVHLYSITKPVLKYHLIWVWLYIKALTFTKDTFCSLVNAIPLFIFPPYIQRISCPEWSWCSIYVSFNLSFVCKLCCNAFWAERIPFSLDACYIYIFTANDLFVEVYLDA